MPNRFIECYLGGSNKLSRLAVKRYPFQVGRQEDLDFAVPSTSASRLHAELFIDANCLMLRDLGSTNGTYLNRTRLNPEQPVAVEHGDIIHFGEFEVRLVEEDGGMDSDMSQTVISDISLSQQLPTGFREIKELLQEKQAIAVFQPIVDASDESVHAFELLGRGTHPELTDSPGPLFGIAESFDFAIELSQLFRNVSLASAAATGLEQKFFLNVHPHEHHDNNLLLAQLADLRRQYPTLKLVLEVHEESTPDIKELKNLIGQLKEIGLEFAYDDFGAGQARLLELVEAPPDYLKFDIGMVRGIDQAPAAKRDMISMLIDQAKKVGAKTLAEGLDRAEEVEACKQLGFDYIQGFFYARPSVTPIVDISNN